MPSTLSELRSRRHLLWVLTTSNIKRTNKHSTLGWLWWLLDPILLGTVYYVLASMLFERRANQPFALYLIIGLVSFKAFNEAVTQSAAVIRGRTAIVRAVSFPKMVLPLSLVLSSTFFFLFSLVAVALLACWYGPRYGTWPSFYYALLPAVIACQVLFSAGIATLPRSIGGFGARTMWSQSGCRPTFLAASETSVRVFLPLEPAEACLPVGFFSGRVGIHRRRR